MHIKKRSILIVTILLLLLFVPNVLAQEPESELSQAKDVGKITIFKDQDAIEQYAKITGLSVNEVKKIVENARDDRASKGVGGHFSVYVPACAHPYNGAALALFDTGPGPISVQYHGNRLWIGSDFCGSANCTFLTTAGLPFSGDTIWAYSVFAGYSIDIAHWCS